ncbi:MAG: hypothetical protein N2C14_00885, partial [Planctomycetales bacterium]
MESSTNNAAKHEEQRHSHTQGKTPMNLSMKIGTGYALMGLLVLVCAGAGYYGLYTLGNSLDFLAGPAWDTADGAMEASIEIEAQMLAVDRIVQGTDDGKDADTDETPLEKAKRKAQEALKRMKDANLLKQEDIDGLNTELTAYETAREDLLAARKVFKATDDLFQTHTTLFVKVSETLEEIGDQSVEELEKEADKQLSWSDGLKDRWEAADGGMESSIGHLTQLYHLQRMKAGTDIEECRTDIKKAQAFHQAAMDSMLATGAFDVPIDHARFGG